MNQNSGRESQPDYQHLDTIFNFCSSIGPHVGDSTAQQQQQQQQQQKQQQQQQQQLIGIRNSATGTFVRTCLVMV